MPFQSDLDNFSKLKQLRVNLIDEFFCPNELLVELWKKEKLRSRVHFKKNYAKIYYFVTPGVAPTLHATFLFKLLMTLLFPTFGKPKRKKNLKHESFKNIFPFTNDSDADTSFYIFVFTIISKQTHQKIGADTFACRCHRRKWMTRSTLKMKQF